MSQYTEFLGRVDVLFASIRLKHPASFACGLGCHSCCKPGLTVNSLEARAISSFLRRNQAVAETCLAREKENPHKGKRCSFLGADGACGIYEARPLVCRSHGAPLQFKDPESEDRFRDVCELNFKGKNIGELPAGDVMNLDTLNTLLALLNRQECGGDETRTPLKASSLLP